MRRIFSMMVGLTIFLSAPVWGMTINVPGDYTTIQAGINAAGNSDTVLVADGVYTENINFSGKAITVISQNGPEFTTIEIQTAGQPVVTFDHGEGRSSVLSGFTVEGDSSYWGVYADNASPTIYNNIVKKHEIGIRVDSGGSPLIRGNEITLCSHSYLQPRNGGGIRLEYSTNATIDSNVIHDNYADVAGGIFISHCSEILVARNLIYSDSSVYIGGMEIAFSNNIEVYNNSLSGNWSTEPNLGSINISNSNYITVACNISAFNNEYGICNYWQNTNIISSYNDVYGNNPANYYNLAPGTGSISADPLFVDLPNGNFNLDEYSPCINSGDPSRVPDPDGSISDMGALYYPLGPLTVGSLDGTVVDTFGLPIQNARVSEPFYGHELWTGSLGEFFIDSLITWSGYNFSFSHPDFVDTTIYGVEITEDDTTELVVVMNPLPPPGAISGVVTDESLVPIGSVYVVISNTGAETYTDINGEFFLGDLQPDEYDLELTHPDFMPGYINDVAVASNDTTEINVVMYEYGEVQGTVTDTSGSPIENVIVTDINTGNKDTTLAGGGYFISQLPAGAHDISFFHYLYGDTTVQDVMINSGQTTNLDVTLSGLQNCDYVTGDVNFSGSFNVLDPMYGVLYFYGLASPQYTCECTPGDIWYVGGDINGSCNFNGLDITRMLFYLRHVWSDLIPCPDCPPADWPSYNLNYKEIIAGIDFDYNSPIINSEHYKKQKSGGMLLTDEGVELWFGNLDESPIDVVPGAQVEINVYIQMASDAYVSCFNLPLGADDDYVNDFLSESSGEIYEMSDWDVAEFVPVDGSPPNPAGWSSQSLLAVIESGPPHYPPWPWLHYESPTLIGKFVLQTVSDTSFVNQTVYCIGPGISSRSGAAVFGDTTAMVEHQVTQHFSPLHFLDPALSAGTLTGTVTDNTLTPIEGIAVSIEGTPLFDVTDAAGNFMIDDVIQGIYDIGFSHPFYLDTVLTDISISANETTDVDIIIYEGINNDIVLAYGTTDGTPLSVVIGNRLYIDVYIQTGSDINIDYFNIALGLEDQYFDSLLSEDEGQIHYVLPQWDDVFFRQPTGSPPNPTGWSAETAVGFRELYEPFNSPHLDCTTPTKILTFVVRIPNNPSLIGNTIQCLGPGIGQFNIATEFADSVGMPIDDFAEYFAPILFLNPAQYTGSLQGIVTNGSQQPIAGAEVLVEGTGFSDLTDGNGAYLIDNIVMGTYNVSFSHTSYCDTVLTGISIADDETTSVDVVMGNGGNIAGTVADAAQAPIESVIVSVEGTGVVDTTDTIGEYMLTGVCPGLYDVSFNHPDYVEQIESDVEVAADSTTTLNVILWPPASNDAVIWYGSPDGSPTNAYIGDMMEIDVYIQTSGDIQIEFVHLALGSEDQYFTDLLSPSLGQIHGLLLQWDEAAFLPPDGSPPNPAGWSNQSLLAFNDLGGPPNPYLNCPVPTRIATFVMEVVNNPSLLGDTLLCLGPGINTPNLGTVLGDSSGVLITDLAEHYNPLYFVDPASLGGVAGTVTDPAQFAIEGVLVTVQGTAAFDSTDGSGQYSCGNIVPGTYSLSFYHPDYLPLTVDNVEIIAGQVSTVDVTLYEATGNCVYVTGDVNNSGIFNGLDVTYGVNFFKGGPAPLYSCECTPGNIWYVAGDINNSCTYNGLDITFGVSYLKGGPDPLACEDCPPTVISTIKVIQRESAK